MVDKEIWCFAFKVKADKETIKKFGIELEKAVHLLKKGDKKLYWADRNPDRCCLLLKSEKLKEMI